MAEHRSRDDPARELDTLLARLRATGGDRSNLRSRLVRCLSRLIPSADLHDITERLSVEEARSRASRCEDALARAAAAAGHDDLALARREAEIACALEPIWWRTHRVLGAVLERLGEVEQARMHYALASHLGWETRESSDALARTTPAPPR